MACDVTQEPLLVITFFLLFVNATEELNPLPIGNIKNKKDPIRRVFLSVNLKWCATHPNSETLYAITCWHFATRCLSLVWNPTRDRLFTEKKVKENQ
jgi:hypothetical protein